MSLVEQPHETRGGSYGKGCPEICQGVLLVRRVPKQEAQIGHIHGYVNTVEQVVDVGSDPWHGKDHKPDQNAKRNVSHVLS